MNIIAYIAKATGLNAREVPVSTHAALNNPTSGSDEQHTGKLGPTPYADEHGVETTEVSGGGTSYAPAEEAAPCPFEVGSEEIENGDSLIPVDVRNYGLEGSRNLQQIESLRQFVWQTDKGKLLYPREMATEHLFYTIRMLFNHSVPPAFRVGQFKRHDNVFEWPLVYKEQAAAALREALQTRKTELTSDMRNEMTDMEANAVFLDLLRNSTGPLVNVPETAVLTSKEIAPVIRRGLAKIKRMRRAVPTTLRGFPGKRCMEHRSYSGTRKPRVDCNACRQVFNARRRRPAPWPPSKI
jgi:hypothetical protein